ncbi:thioredoxin domain-containing protein [Limnoglobus roseus]|uniref:Thioredoxin family protein n=1 Tax=Limnoglobus roseus TaxID=2598579 RepID=A0A5C1A852_9BACT|nr:hypothetical protein [Limnoglobus roseus]QEL14930.1 thioredoxin family protein [Limnoglobus roseus]
MSGTALADRPAVRDDPEAVAWQPSYTQGSKRAAADNKPLIVFIGAGPTGYRRAVQEGRLSDELVKTLTDQCVCVYFDTKTEDGRKMAKLFEVEGPGLVVSTRGGGQVHKTHSAPPTTDQLLEDLKAVVPR